VRIENITEENLRQATDNELYSLRLRFMQLPGWFAKNPLITPDWGAVFAKASLLADEIKNRPSISIDPDEWLSTYKQRDSQEFYIRAIGAMAQTRSKQGKHFCLLIHHKDSDILVDPAVPAREIEASPTVIIITQADRDHWTHLGDFATVPLYSTGSILDQIDSSFATGKRHPFLKPISFDGLVIRPIRTIHRVGSPSIGIRVERGRHKVSILPEFLRLGEAERELIAGTAWIAGCGDYEDDDEEAGKLSFKSLMDLADELKPRAVFLTNLRTALLKHRNAVRLALSNFDGQILMDGDTVQSEELEKSDTPGIYLVPPHGQWIWEGKKKLIIKAKEFPNMVNVPLVLVSGKKAYGVIRLHKPNKIDLNGFDLTRMGHLISDKERVDWWGGWRKEFYAYDFDIIEKYQKPRSVIAPRGAQTFIEDVKFEDAVRKASAWGLAKPSYRIFSLEDLKNTPGFDKGRAVIESKFDGVRARVERGDNGEVRIMTDPEETATPIKTKRLPWQAKELEKLPGGGFSLDAEIVMVKDGECLHRTSVNALINGKFDPTEASKLAHIYVFDILEFEGKSLKNAPLEERKEELARFSDSEHIHFIRPTISLDKPSLSYVVDLERAADVQKALSHLLSYAHKGGPFPKKISEGCMIKKLDSPYTGKTWVKFKEEYEVDCLVVGKHEIIREGKKTGNWNYDLAVGAISRPWAEAISRSNKKAVIEFEGKFYNITGKSDNTGQDVRVGSILRVAAEDVNRFETDNPEYPYYKTYVARVKQPVPERHNPDSMFVLQRLSEMTPRRETFVKAGIQDDMKVSIEAGKIPREIYNKYAGEGDPLPAEFYTDYRKGTAWLQSHLRGIKQEDREAYEKKEVSFADTIKGHSIHLDLRLSIEGLPKLVQYVITESDVPSYFRMLRGEKRETAGGVENVQHSFIVIKPSALQEPEVKKAEEELIIDESGSKLIADYQIFGKSYWIPPGEVGSSAYKYAWMGLLWTGTVRGGIMRRDYKELFFYPDRDLPKKNKELLDGKFIIKCLKRPEGTARWEIWRATKDPWPQDPIEHKDSGDWYPVKAEDVKSFGREHYTYGRKEPE